VDKLSRAGSKATEVSLSRKQSRVSQPTLAKAADQSDAILLGKAVAADTGIPSLENAYEQNQLPDSFSGLAEAYKWAFGKKIVLVTPKRPRADFFNGVRT